MVKAMEKFSNKYTGERIFILGNGPSLKETPLEKLIPEYTLAMNRISQIYPKTNWRPSFYYLALTPSNPVAPDQGNELILRNIELDIPCFINSEYQEDLGSHENVYYFNRFSLWGDNPFNKSDIDDIRLMDIYQLNEYWSHHLSYHVYHYHAMYGALQLAVYMGFDEIYLVGCDLGFEYKDPHMIFNSGLDPFRYEGGKTSYIRDSIKNGELFQSVVNAICMKLILNINISTNSIFGRYLYQSWNDHFSPEYFQELRISDGPKLEKEVKKTHVAAKRICENEGIAIYNATLGGELEIYDRVNIFDLL